MVNGDQLLMMLSRVYGYILLARVLVSFIQVDPYHPAVQFLYSITEPVLKPIRERLPSGQGLDFSPMIAWVLLQLVTTVLVSTF